MVSKAPLDVGAACRDVRKRCSPGADECESRCGFDVAQQMHGAKESKCNRARAAVPPSKLLPCRNELRVTWQSCHVLSQSSAQREERKKLRNGRQGS